MAKHIHSEMSQQIHATFNKTTTTVYNYKYKQKFHYTALVSASGTTTYLLVRGLL